MARFNALVFALAAAASLESSTASEYQVRVRNLSYLQPFSPVLAVAHTNDVALFKEGSMASDALQLMAEDGDNSGLVTLIADDSVAPYICGYVMGDAPLFLGETWTGDLYVDYDTCGDRPKFSLVAMLINTNDAFVGIDSQDLEASKTYPPAFDAGTEDNNELCAYIPGPGCADVPGNLAAGNGEGYIHVHRGMVGIGNLSESAYDWRNPVAEVLISSS